MADPVMKLNNLVGDLRLATLAIAGCMVAFTGASSANSITLSKSEGKLGGSSYSISTSFTVTVFANLTAEGGGQETIGADVSYDPSKLTATACDEFHTGTYLLGTSPSPHFGQVVAGMGVYEPFSRFPVGASCGASTGGPNADGGLTTPGVVRLIAQEFTGPGVPATSGTLILGTVTFHAIGATLGTTIGTTFEVGGFIGSDFINRTGGSLGSVTVTIIPEPTTLALLSFGVLGLGLSSRRLRRR